MTNNKSTQLKCLTISKELINLNCDWNTKAALAYIQYRLNLKGFRWTFSQSDFVKTLNISKSVVSRLFQKLIDAGVFQFERTETTRNNLKLKIYSVNKDNYNKYLNSPKAAQSQSETVPNKVEQSQSGNIQSHNETVTVPLRECDSPELGTIIKKENKDITTKIENKNNIISVIPNLEPTVTIEPKNKDAVIDEFDIFFSKTPRCYDLTKVNLKDKPTVAELSYVMNNPQGFSNIRDVAYYLMKNSLLFDSEVLAIAKKYL